MSETITSESRPSYGVTFGKKVSDGAYGGDDFSVWVSADVDASATETEKYDALNAAANIAKALVYDHFQIEAALDGVGVMRAAVKRVERAFGKTVDVTPPAGHDIPGVSTGVGVKGQQYGELPTWLLEAAAKDGVTEVYDNRGDLSDPAKAKRPHFKSTTGGDQAKAYWPPRGK